MRRLPERVFTAPGIYYAVRLEPVFPTGTLGYVDHDRRRILVDEDVPHIEKLHVLMYGIIRIMEKRLLGRGILQQPYEQHTATHMAGMLFMMLGASGMICGITHDEIMEWVSKKETGSN